MSREIKKVDESICIKNNITVVERNDMIMRWRLNGMSRASCIDNLKEMYPDTPLSVIGNWFSDAEDSYESMNLKDWNKDLALEIARLEGLYELAYSKGILMECRLLLVEIAKLKGLHNGKNQNITSLVVETKWAKENKESKK